MQRENDGHLRNASRELTGLVVAEFLNGSSKMDDSEVYSSNSEGHYSDLATDCGGTTDNETDFGSDDELPAFMDTTALISSINDTAGTATAEVWIFMQSFHLIALVVDIMAMWHDCASGVYSCSMSCVLL